APVVVAAAVGPGYGPGGTLCIPGLPSLPSPGGLVAPASTAMPWPSPFRATPSYSGIVTCQTPARPGVYAPGAGRVSVPDPPAGAKVSAVPSLPPMHAGWRL